MSNPPAPKRHPLKYRLYLMLNVWMYKLTGGRLGGQYRGVNILLLEHIGRKSGKKHTTPVFFIQDGDRYLIAASDQGAAKNPAWYWNITGTQPVKIQVMNKVMPVTVTEAAPEERDRLFQRFQELPADNFVRYQKRTERKIPVMILTPQPRQP
jgi:deazaflavin-dependent oxidoreductase (nitroreductase family)